MKCVRCSIDKAPDAFYAKDRTCKECRRALVKANRERNAEHYRDYDQRRANRPDRVAAREAYRQTDAGKAAVKRAHDAYHLREPERRKARVDLGNAVRDGRVIPWPVCAVPDCCAKPEAHHPDYGQPLDVVWLCSSHHKQAHALVDT